MRTFVTIQATGPVFCPYTVAHRATFLWQLRALGHELVDGWSLNRSLEVPFEPWTRVDHDAGLCLRRSA